MSDDCVIGEASDPDIPNLLHRKITAGVYFIDMANVATPDASNHIQIMDRFSAVPDASFIPLEIITNKKIGPGPKLVYSRLLAYAATNETATNNRLAADLAASPRSVRNYIAALKTAGLVEVLFQPSNARSFKLTTI